MLCTTRLDDQMLAIIERTAKVATIMESVKPFLFINLHLSFILGETAPESIFDLVLDGIDSALIQMDAGIADGKKLVFALKGLFPRYREEEIWIKVIALGVFKVWEIRK